MTGGGPAGGDHFDVCADSLADLAQLLLPVAGRLAGR